MKSLVRYFRVNVVIRLLVILALMALLNVSLTRSAPWVLTNIFLGMAILGVTAGLVRYVERSQRELKNFLLSIKHRDFALNFTTANQSKNITQLHEAFNTIVGSYHKLRVEKEVHYQYLQNIIEHINVALMCYKEDGEIALMNQAAHTLLGRPYLSNLQGVKLIDESLYESIQALEPGEQVLKKVILKGVLYHLAIHSSRFKLVDGTFTLISLQDIKSELEEQEVEAWQKLIRVLTHEIMNSVTPVLSLTGALKQQLEHMEADDSPPEKEDLEDLQQGIRAIENRSEGLLQFVHAYRSLTRLPMPKFDTLALAPMLDRLGHLFREEWDKAGIDVSVEVEPNDLEILADATLVDQVLINLIKNAMEAVKEVDIKQIRITGGLDERKRPIIQVKDSGKGIDPELHEKIFIPFFTTKKQGSGIGLSLSRQIMRLHKGNITFQTELGKGTVFTLAF